MGEKSRRSFLVDLLSTIAGGWVVVTGLVGAGAALSGCSDDSKTPTKDSQVVKYGGPVDGSVDGMVTKYGGPPDGMIDTAKKYGGQPDGMVTKYGGFDAAATKYGGPQG